MKQTSTLQIKGFPADVNKALKMKALKQGVTLREYILGILKAAAK